MIVKRMLSSAAIAALSFGAAVAADLPTKKSPPPLPALVGVDWSGFYIGANVGLSDGRERWSDPAGVLLINTPRLPATGATIGQFGGLTIGYNFQFGPWVIGAEGDIDASNAWGSAVCGGTFGVGGVGWKCLDRDRYFGTGTARVGYAAGRSLYYAKGGAAYDNRESIITAFNTPFPDPYVSSTQGRWGWTLGAGIEYAISANWSAKAEYDFLDFGKRNFSVIDPVFGPTGAATRSYVSLFKFGLNYRLGGGAGPGGGSAPTLANDVAGEFGLRTGFAQSYFRKKLYDPFVTSQLNSQLTWPHQDGLALEGFARLDLSSGIFAKGFIGGVSLDKGNMTDEDFPPGIVPYSDTSSSTKNGREIYGTGDIGYAYGLTPGWKLGGFVGYNHYANLNSAYGCTQIATNSGICAPGQVLSSELTLSENQHWDSMRLGLNIQGNLTDRFKLTLDGAWLPISEFSATDNHWLRPNINPLAEKGHGSQGYQLEGVLSYLLTDNLSVGAGARYWSFSAPSGSTQFPGGFPQSPEKFKSTNTMGFLQLSYALGK